MRLYSTNHKAPDVDLKEAVLKGLPPDNGLYMPHHIDPLPAEFWSALGSYSFNEMAFRVAEHLIGSSVPKADLERIIEDAYDFAAPIVSVGDQYILELFHGPTLAFKDFGARFMGRLMGYFLRGSEQTVHILVATSGDTGSAVAHGFLNVDGIEVTILYPKGKVSDIQEKQFTTLGANITAVEIDGTFDDCQALVKQAFLDAELNAAMTLSSANSINIARLIPQSFYYIYAYKQLDNKNLPLYYCVPSGNFGNLTAGLFAKRLGLPVDKMIAATNANDIFTQYHQTGFFSPRPSVKTISNAMDVGNPSNFARMMDMYGNDADRLRAEIAAYSFTDEQTAAAIRQVYRDDHYLMCPHTAVAYLGMEQFLAEHESKQVNAVSLATAHPVKFGEVVEPLIGEPVEIPERLKRMLGTEKRAIPMSKEFPDFKAWLRKRA